MALAEKHLDLLAARDFIRIKRALRCNDDALRAAHALICTLNPRPGAQYARLETRYIVPYRVQGDAVEILRVFHTSRRLPPRW